MDEIGISIGDFDYALGEDRIARFPARERDRSKLLVYDRGRILERGFRDLPSLLPPGSLMVFNNTRVIQARMHFRKGTGSLVEVFLLEPLEPMDYQLSFQATGACSWACLVGGSRKWREGSLLRDVTVGGRAVTLAARRGGAAGTGFRVDFSWDGPGVTFAEIIEAAGELPLPPYLNREAGESDKVSYQTVYSRISGSVAAPTAGLHFSDSVLRAIDERGIERLEVTLHVGAGTFRPVKAGDISGHDMHAERFGVSRVALERLLAHGAAAIAVGTTSVRTLESLYLIGARMERDPDPGPDGLCVGQWEPYGNLPDVTPERALGNVLAYMDRHAMGTLRCSTRVMIVPGYRYRVVRMLVTNFHQPRSTLLLLVGAFVGGDWRRIYDYALGHGFRFLSYGDSSLLIPKTTDCDHEDR